MIKNIRTERLNNEIKVRTKNRNWINVIFTNKQHNGKGKLSRQFINEYKPFFKDSF